MRLRIGHLSTLYHTSIVMMARKELLQGFSSEVQWRLFGTGPAIIEALSRNELDMAYIGLPPAIIGISNGLKIRCISGGHIEGTVIAAHTGAAGFPETGDLGEILSQFGAIGVPGRGSIHDLILMDAINRYKVTVNVKNLPWADEVLEAFVRGEVDAVIGTPALAQAVIDYAAGRIVYPPYLLWPDNPSYGIVVKEDLLYENRDILLEFLIRHEGASGVLRMERRGISEEIAGLIGMVEEDFVYNTLNISPRYCAALTNGYIGCTMGLAERLKELGYIESAVKEDDIFDPSLIRETHPEPDHYK